MDDKTPTPDQTPDHSADQPTVPVAPMADASPQAPTSPEPASAPAAASASAEKKPGRKRALLIGGGIAAALLLAGGGAAVGAAIGDEFGDDDDRPGMSDGPRHDADERGDDDRGGAPGERRDDEGAPSNDRGPVTGIGTASADDLIDIAEAARGAADGDVTSIDAKRDGAWEVQLTTASGDETEVRVDDEPAATVISTDPADGDDTGPTLTLDDETIRSLVAAALAEAEGMITDLDVDSDDASPYDASVLTSENHSIDIDFAADFAVVGTDTDN